MRCDKFKATVQSINSKICSTHFLPSDYHSYARELKPGVVPSVFDLPEHLKKATKERKPRKRDLSYSAAEGNSQSLR